jgi:hypothetical protein
MQAAELLAQLLCQDIERKGDGGPGLKQGLAKDRIVSVHDPEMRCGHKSAKKHFGGHKAAIPVDLDTQLITAVDLLPGNAYDSERALELVQQIEENTDMQVEETIGDCAYGDGDTREKFEKAGRKLVARVPKRPNRVLFPKEAFAIDLQAMTCTCPANQVTSRLVSIGRGKSHNADCKKGQAFRFDGALCDRCELRAQCTRAGPGKGRLVSLHPQERLLQEARALQESPFFREYRLMRQASEHCLARLIQLGVRKARFFGRTKALFQALMAAAVANLTLTAAKTGEMCIEESPKSGSHLLFSQFRRLVGAIINHAVARFRSLVNTSPSTAFCRPCFRPSF